MQYFFNVSWWFLKIYIEVNVMIQYYYKIFSSLYEITHCS